jgi:hypothetical protein
MGKTVGVNAKCIQRHEYQPFYRACYIVRLSRAERLRFGRLGVIESADDL